MNENMSYVVLVGRMCAKDDLGARETDFKDMAEHWSSPRVLELHEGKRGSSSSIFQVNISNRSIFVKQVFNILWANIRREVPDVNTTVIVSRGSSKPTARHGNATVQEVSELACLEQPPWATRKRCLRELRVIQSSIYLISILWNSHSLNPKTILSTKTTRPN